MKLPELTTESLIRLLVGGLISFALGYHGYRKKSLSLNGSIAAFIVGFITFAASVRFGVILIVFYYTSSKLTKLKEDRKKLLESTYKEGGQRDVTQVLSCSLFPTIVCLLLVLHYQFEAPTTEFDFTRPDPFPKPSIHAFFPFNYLLSPFPAKSFAYSYATAFIISFYACCNADTWASEIGILSKSAPRLITNFQPCPPGTNGGISVLGTCASIAGGATIGFTYWSLTILYLALDVERQYDVDVNYFALKLAPIILISACIGFIGSTIDSLIGATLQASYYDKDSKMIVSRSEFLMRNCSTANKGHDVKNIGGLDLLSNEAVNCVSSLVSGLIGACITESVFVALK